ncbi:hypothetical protein TOPH_02612, partial [Tolypocladium ophioglossoides CBS 100239]
MSALQKALPLALTVFCGVLGGRFAVDPDPSCPGYYTFQPVLAPKDLPGEGQTK